MSSSTSEAARPFSVSVVENTAPGGRMCKVYEYDEKTAQLTSSTNAFLSDGRVRTVSFRTMEEFMAFRSTLAKNAAFMMGVPLYPDARIITQEMLALISPEARQRDRIIARDRAHVNWPEGPAVAMCDLEDPNRFPADVRVRAPTTPEDWRRLLIELFPALDEVQMSWAPSSSSCLYVADRELHGVRGQRFYFLITSGQDIPRFKEALHDGLVKRGLVWYEVSRSGALLLRSPLDLAVYQPERLDFAAGPECRPPLEWRPVPYKVWNDAVGTFLCATDFPPSTEADRRRVRAALADLRRAKMDEAQAVRRKWRQDTGRRIATHLNIDPARAEEVAAAAVDRGVLLSDFLLTDSDGETVSVGELLDDPSKHNGRRFHDPLEPDYRNDPRIAVFLVGDDGQPRIYSHAHGGQSWRCQRTLPVVYRTQIDKTVDQLARVLEQDDLGIYRAGNVLVWVNEVDAKVQKLTPEGLGLRLQRRCIVLKLTRTGWVPGDLTLRILNALESEAPVLPVRQVRAVVRGPFARSDGSIVDTPGYDPASQVVYVADSPYPPKVRRTLSIPEAEEALRRLWHPVQYFPMKTAVDRGVVLSAMLTALVRGSLPIAPGFYITAHAAGTGKTLLAQTIGALQTGAAVAMSPLPEDEAERRKHVFACLRSGTDYLFYDNAQRGSTLDSPVLAHLVTSPLIEERVLGISSVECHPNRLTVVLTGNNLALRGDLNRRILPVTLDAGVEHPWQREFPFHPVSYVLAHWLPLRIAGLELIQAWLSHGAPRAPGATGFPEWDAVVRSVLVWVMENLNIGVEFADPAEAFRAAYADDPESEILGNLLEAWYGHFKEREVLVKEIEEAVTPSSNDTFPTDVISGPPQGSALSLAEARRAVLDNTRTWIRDERQAFGVYLSQHEGRIVRGLRLVKGQTRGGARLWRVERVRSDSTSTSEPTSAMGGA